MWKSHSNWINYAQFRLLDLIRFGNLEKIDKNKKVAPRDSKYDTVSTHFYWYVHVRFLILNKIPKNLWNMQKIPSDQIPENKRSITPFV